MLNSLASDRFAVARLRRWRMVSSFVVPKTLPFFYFDALTARVDLLEPRQVQALRHCYTWVREIPLRSELLCADAQAVQGSYVIVPPNRLEPVKSWFALLEKYADQALKDLGSQ